MSEFEALILTRKGKELMAKAQIGAIIEFSKAVLGDGSFAQGQTVDGLEAVLNSKMDVAIHSLDVPGDGSSEVQIIFNNTDLEEGFFIREIGLMAIDPDEGEILYSYSNAGQDCDFLIAGGGPRVVEIDMGLITVVGNASEVTARINSSLLALLEDVTKHNTDPAAHSGRMNAIQEALDLYRVYNPYYVELELWSPSLTMLYGMTNVVTEASAGSNLIDVSGTDNIEVGKHYVVFDDNNAERIEIAQIVDHNTVRAVANMTNDFEDANIRRTSWIVEDGQAVAVGGGVYYAGPLSLLNKNCDKGLVIRRTDNDATLAVSFIDSSHPEWVDVPWSWERDQGGGVVDVEYIVPARGFFLVRIESTAGASAVDPTIDHIVFCECESGLNGTHRPSSTPTIVFPANDATNIGEQPSLTTSAYSHPVGTELDGAWFQISSDPDFTEENIIVNSGIVAGISWAPDKGALSTSTTYYVRAYHKDNKGGASAWSATVAFTTASSFVTVTKPTGTVPAAGIELSSPNDLTLVSSVFGTEGGTDTHANSQWQVAPDPLFTTILHDSGTTATNLVSYDVPDGNIDRDNTYYWRVRHEGTAEGWSDWSTAIMFSISDFTFFVTTLGCDYYGSGRGVITDDSGNIYVAGSKKTAVNNTDAVLVKFAPDGSIIWQKQLGGSNAEYFISMALDGSGNIYAAGYENSSTSGSTLRALLVKFAPDGTVIWQKSLASTNNSQFNAVAVDGSGNAYAAGWEVETNNPHPCALLVKFAADGSVVWQKSWDGGSGNNRFNAVAVDDSGNIYAAGYVDTVASDWAMLVKFAADGSVIWKTKVSGSGHEQFNGVAVDGSGNLYAAGRESSTTGNIDLLLVKFASDGSVVWQKSLCASTGGTYMGDVAADDSGNVYISGLMSLSGSLDALLAKFTSVGTMAWQKSLGGNGYEEFYSVAVNDSENLYAVGRENSTSTDHSILLAAVNTIAENTSGVIPDITSLSWADAGLSLGTPSLPISIPSLNLVTLSWTVVDPSLTLGSASLTQTLSEY